jgi:hypothetical protein
MKKTTSVFFWIPRILCILAILTVSMFALDSFGPGQTIWHQLATFGIHLIPSFILTAILLIAWKWEFIGGIILIALGLFFSPFIFRSNYRMNHSVWMSLGVILIITIPFILTGIFFLISWFKNKKESLPV